MQIQSSLGDKGLYILDCVDQKHLDEILEIQSKLNSIKQLHYFRSSFTLSRDELSTYLKLNINAAIMEYLNKSNKNKSEYILTNCYPMSNWMLGKSLAPHIDSIKHDHKDTHSPRAIINCLLYLTDDYDGGEIIFPDIGKAIKPKAGSVIVFDSDLKHGVNAVKSGTRKTLESNLFSIYSEDIEEVKSQGWRRL